ncbi:hypothetical protein BJV82DRAFT_665814 [Fennellomyces sp. T-0311]|nr:hypothetical protein BJV82DRAFT_665814 [Fennellomyces sp. T-0311]
MSNAQYNNSEVSAQKVAYNILRLPMSVSTSAATYIPTSPPEERRWVLKPARELKRINDPTSTECFEHNILDYYVERPISMRDVTLASFAASYNYSKTIPRGNTHSNDNDEFELETGEVHNTDGQDDNADVQDDNVDAQDGGSNAVIRNYIELQNSDGYICKRKTLKVIRFRRYRLQQGPQNYYRELLMLYFPWFDEEFDLLLVDCDIVFRAHQEQILVNRCEFTSFDDAALMETLQNAKDRHNEPDIEDDPQHALENPLDEYELDEGM